MILRNEIFKSEIKSSNKLDALIKLKSLINGS